MPGPLKAIVIAGPTACGKSELGAALAARCGGVVINADSLQLYDGLTILTAQPDPDQRERAPHRLYGILRPDASTSVAAWLGTAKAAIEEARGEGRRPVIVGGTGLYIEVLLDGLNAMPEVPPAVRKNAEDELDAMGRATFHARLAAIDPAAAAATPSQNTHRLIRAWSVYAATGRTITSWRAAPRHGIESDAHVIVSLPARDDLRAACDRRFLAMLDAGASDEVAAFRKIHADDAPAARALGFAHIAACLDGIKGETEMISGAQAATRQYAKRQTTWFQCRLAKRNGALTVGRAFGMQDATLFNPSLR